LFFVFLFFYFFIFYFYFFIIFYFFYFFVSQGSALSSIKVYQNLKRLFQFDWKYKVLKCKIISLIVCILTLHLTISLINSRSIILLIYERARGLVYYSTCIQLISLSKK
jgi:hypothetical protein